MELSVVAPCFNEAEGLKEFYLRIIQAINASKIKFYEIILIDDGSSDATWSLIQQLHLMNPQVRGMRLSRNFGHQSALTAGLASATGNYTLIIDSDLQDPPELLPAMLEKLNQGHDVVYGQRIKRHGESAFKKSSASLFYKCLAVISEINIPRDTGDFRLISKRVLIAYNSLAEGQRFTRGLIAWLGFHQTPIEYEREPRFIGESNYPLSHMLSLALDAITGFSLRPLRALMCLGGVLLMTGLGMLMALIYFWVTQTPAPAGLLILTGFILMGSLQILGIGIVGEYTGRTLIESKRRPLYVVKDLLVTETIRHPESRQYPDPAFNFYTDGSSPTIMS